MLHMEELVTMFTRAEIDMVIYSSKHAKVVEGVVASGISLAAAVCMDNNAESDEVFRNYADVESSVTDFTSYENLEINAGDLGILLFTSGTTSKSKIVMLSQRNICSDIMSMFRMCKMGPGDRFLTLLPCITHMRAPADLSGRYIPEAALW